MRIGPGPFRPRWFQPVAIFWTLMGLPIAIFAPIVWITGVAVTEQPPPPPALGTPSFFIAAALKLAVLAWVFVTPALLVMAELKFRRLRREAEMGSNAQD